MSLREPTTDTRLERLARLRRGAAGEWVAVALLIGKGYRILARRLRTPHGEIDIVAARRGRIAFVEVKRRATMEEAEAAITDGQTRRIADAAQYWLARHPSYLEREMGLDAIFIVPGQWPRHMPNLLADV